MRTPHSCGHGYPDTGRGNQMDVVRHQAVGPNIEPELAACRCKHRQVDLAVIGREEYIRTVVSAVRDVIRLVENNDSGKTRHSGIPVSEESTG